MKIEIDLERLSPVAQAELSRRVTAHPGFELKAVREMVVEVALERMLSFMAAERLVAANGQGSANN